MSDQFDLPEDGKVAFAADPSPLLAAAQRLGLDARRLQQSGLAPAGCVLVVDLDALRLPDDWTFDPNG